MQALPTIDDRLFPVSYSLFYQTFKADVLSAGIKDFTGHDLRHSFASHLLMAGADLATVSRLMGHATLNMTMRYAHLSQRHEADAVAKLDAKLAQSRKVFDGDPTEVVEIPSKQVANAVSIT